MTIDQTMRALADAATDGPWEVTADTVSSEYGDWVAHGIKDVAATRDYFDSDPYHVALDPLEKPDAEFIAAAREWVPDAIRRIEAVREACQSRIDKAADSGLFNGEPMPVYVPAKAILRILGGDK